MKRRLFISDTNARIPFAILGVFIVLGSSLTSVYLSNIDSYSTEVYLSSSQDDELKHLIKEAETNIKMMINSAGMKSFEIIGKTPVISSVHEAYSAEEVNIVRFKKTLIAQLNQVLMMTFSNNQFHNGKYALNIHIPNGQDVPIMNLGDISIQSIDMTLDRPIHIPLIGPDKSEHVEIYWEVSIPLTCEIRSLNDNKLISMYPSNISRVITSRYPVLFHLVKDFNYTLQNLGPFWGFVTLLTNIYSLVRGYKHFQSGNPRNVVDNKHLAPLINAGVLFEQGLCFGSVDPLAIVDFVSESTSVLFAGNKTDPTSMMNGFDSNSFFIDKSWFSSIPQKSDTSQQEDSEESFSSQINISDVASMIRYDMRDLTIFFKTLSTDEVYSIFLPDPDESDVDTVIDNHITDDTILFDITKSFHGINETTSNTINQIINDTYTSTFEAGVIRDVDPTVLIGNHRNYTIDNGSTPWIVDSMELMDIKDKPSRGMILKDSIVYEEMYTVTYSRVHHWSRREIIESSNSSSVQWFSMSTVDKKIEQNVTCYIIVRNISNCSCATQSIHDVYYENQSFNDSNLEDTIEIYKTQVFDEHRDQLFTFPSGCYFRQDISGSFSSWVFSESLNAIDDVLGVIDSIQLNESIHPMEYANPLTLIEKSKNDLLNTYDSSRAVMKNESVYLVDDEFQCTGKKAVYCVRSWFIDLVDATIEHMFNRMCGSIEHTMSDELDDVEFHHQDEVLTLLDEQNSGSSLDSFIIPFGSPLHLTSHGSNILSQWNESIHVAVDQYPNYLSPFHETEYEGKREYFLAVRNTCLLGPTGVPILPLTPTTPWLVTMNLWLVSCRGSFAEFMVIDGNNECIPNPLFGHDSQVFIRKDQDIYDEQGLLIGRNTRIMFSIDTICTSVVPSYGMMVGDTQKGLVEENGFE